MGLSLFLFGIQHKIGCWNGTWCIPKEPFTFFFEKKRTFYIYMVCLHQKLPDLRWFVVIVQLFIKRWVSCSLLLCQMFRFSEVQAPCCPSNFAAWILFFSSTHMIFISWQDGEGGVWFGKRKKKEQESYLSFSAAFLCLCQYRGYFFCMCLSIFYCQLECELLFCTLLSIGHLGGLYSGGSAQMVEKSLNIHGDEILYVGDHIYTDVSQSKVHLRWRTALICRELEDEVCLLTFSH